MKSNKDLILKMYFEEKMKPIEIAQKLEISKSAVTQHLRKDSRYEKEKNIRKYENQQKHIQNTKEYIKRKREEKKADDLILKKLHKTSSIELSARKNISNTEYRRWNSSSYIYDSKKNRYEFFDESKRCYAVPKYIKNRRK